VAYIYLALWAYVLYGLGIATPYLRDELGLTQFEAGLHASALAVGTLIAGVSADAIARYLGPSRLVDLAVLYLCAGVAALAAAPTLVFSLGGAFLLGLGGGSLGTYVNTQFSHSVEADSRKMLSRANAWAMVAAMAAPLAIGGAASLAHAWRLAFLLPIAALVALTVLRPRENFVRTRDPAPRTSLPRTYWIAWAMLILAVAIEFSFVYWGSTIVARRTGISEGQATLLASFFVAGMLAGRSAIGGGFGARRSTRGLMTVSLVVALVGASVVWVSTMPLLSGAGLFLGGLGTSSLWPVGLSVAMRQAPRATIEASARATLGSGLAVLIAPSALGLAADGVGVVAAWPIILGLAVAGLVVMAATPASGPADAPEAGVTA
jgi:MFS family permease